MSLPLPYTPWSAAQARASTTGDLLPSLPVLPVTFAQMGVEHWNFWNEGRLTCFLFWMGVGSGVGPHSNPYPLDSRWSPAQGSPSSLLSCLPAELPPGEGQLHSSSRWKVRSGGDPKL